MLRKTRPWCDQFCDAILTHHPPSPTVVTNIVVIWTQHQVNCRALPFHHTPPITGKRILCETEQDILLSCFEPFRSTIIINDTSTHMCYFSHKNAMMYIYTTISAVKTFISLFILALLCLKPTVVVIWLLD